MHERSQPDTDPNSSTALLCLTTGDANEAAFAPCLGKPLIYHQIKALRRAGFQSVRIYVEAVPGILLTTIDMLQLEGVDVRAVRSVDELSSTIGADGPLLVLQSDLWWQADWLTEIVRDKQNAIYVFAEQEGNEAFERIDLNSRWSGLLLCDARIFPALGEIPEGWDLASLLLRQAQQAGFASILLPQTVLTSGSLRKVDVGKGIETVEDAVSDTLIVSTDNAESRLVVKGFRRLPGWSNPQHWAHNAGLWTSVATAGLSALLAVAGFATAALGFACLSALVQPARKFLRMINYQGNALDGVQAAANGALLCALFFCLMGGAKDIMRSGFLALVFAGAYLVSAGRVSLLSVTVILWVGQIAGYLEQAVMMAVLLILAVELISSRRADIQA